MQLIITIVNWSSFKILSLLYITDLGYATKNDGNLQAIFNNTPGHKAIESYLDKEGTPKSLKQLNSGNSKTELHSAVKSWMIGVWQKTDWKTDMLNCNLLQRLATHVIKDLMGDDKIVELPAGGPGSKLSYQ